MDKLQECARVLDEVAAVKTGAKMLLGKQPQINAAIWTRLVAMSRENAGRVSRTPAPSEP